MVSSVDLFQKKALEMEYQELAIRAKKEKSLWVKQRYEMILGYIASRIEEYNFE